MIKLNFRRRRSRSRSKEMNSHLQDEFPNSRAGKKREKSRSPKPQKSRPDKRQKAGSSKMSEEEKAKKLREMMSNADWRDEQRTKRNYYYYYFFIINIFQNVSFEKRTRSSWPQVEVILADFMCFQIFLFCYP